MLQEFKAFAMKGNVVDLAVGVIIGGAFGKIVSSLIEDLIMPTIGKLIGNVDFSNLYIPLSGQALGLSLQAAKAGGAVLAYGNFITILVNFIILALSIFMVVKGMTAMKKSEEAKPETPIVVPDDVKLLTEIRDILKK